MNVSWRQLLFVAAIVGLTILVMKMFEVNSPGKKSEPANGVFLFLGCPDRLPCAVGEFESLQIYIAMDRSSNSRSCLSRRLLVPSRCLSESLNLLKFTLEWTEVQTHVQSRQLLVRPQCPSRTLSVLKFTLQWSSTSPSPVG